MNSFDGPLPIMLEMSVMLRIKELSRRGGPTDADFDRIRDFAHVLASKADVLMFGGKKKGEAGNLFNQLADAVAVMAFVPGGVTIFGRKYVKIQRIKLNRKPE